MKITLPLPPNMANGRFHWRVKNNKRKAYFEACGIVRVLLTAEERKARYGTREEPKADHSLPFPKAKVRATIYCGGRMDHDNALARMKWPIDWMVGAGILAGDKPSQLEWEWPIEQVVKRNQQYRVEFELSAGVISGKTEDAK